MKLSQNVCLDDSKAMFKSILSLVKTRLPGQTNEKPCTCKYFVATFWLNLYETCPLFLIRALISKMFSVERILAFFYNVGTKQAEIT